MYIIAVRVYVGFYGTNRTDSNKLPIKKNDTIFLSREQLPKVELDRRSKSSNAKDGLK